MADATYMDTDHTAHHTILPSPHPHSPRFPSYEMGGARVGLAGAGEADRAFLERNVPLRVVLDEVVLPLALHGRVGADAELDEEVWKMRRPAPKTACTRAVPNLRTETE